MLGFIILASILGALAADYAWYRNQKAQLAAGYTGGVDESASQGDPASLIYSASHANQMPELGIARRA